MRRDRPFWKESDSTVTPEDLFAPCPDDIRGRQRAIGAHLRHWYDTVAREPVPDEWLALLEQGDAGSQIEQAEKSCVNEQAGTA